MRHLPLLLALALPPASLGAQSTPGWPGLTQALDEYVATEGLVGATVALVQDGRIVARHHVGMADRATQRPVTDSTVFHWASITKTLGAVAVLQLRDAGRLRLDDPILRWVPELRRLHDPYGMLDAISLRMVLSHTAGFRAGTWPYGTGAPWEPFEPTEWAQLVAMMPWQQLAFPPGSRYGYSNPGYIYLARVVEAEGGLPWAEYVRRRLWEPLGMTRSYVGAVTPPTLRPHRSHGYAWRLVDGRDSLVDIGADFDPGITIPNSGWNAPVDDVARWAAFLMGNLGAKGEAVLARRTLQEMWEPVAEATRGYTGGEAMGLGFFLVERDGRRTVGHTGDQAGYRSFLYVDPAARTAVILNVNTTNEAHGDPARWRALVERGLEALDRADEDG